MDDYQHLISEAKVRLDRAAEAAEAAEVTRRVLRDINPGDPPRDGSDDQFMADLQEACNLRNRAATRYHLLSRIYDIGCAHGTEADIHRALAEFLFRSPDDIDNQPAVKGPLKLLSEALHDYFNGSFDDRQDAHIRRAWSAIEEALRALGRDM